MYKYIVQRLDMNTDWADNTKQTGNNKIMIQQKDLRRKTQSRDERCITRDMQQKKINLIKLNKKQGIRKDSEKRVSIHTLRGKPFYAGILGSEEEHMRIISN